MSPWSVAPSATAPGAVPACSTPTTNRGCADRSASGSCVHCVVRSAWYTSTAADSASRPSSDRDTCAILPGEVHLELHAPAVRGQDPARGGLAVDAVLRPAVLGGEGVLRPEAVGVVVHVGQEDEVAGQRLRVGRHQHRLHHRGDAAVHVADRAAVEQVAVLPALRPDRSSSPSRRSRRRGAR